jgi:hypothetical protein
MAKVKEGVGEEGPPGFAGLGGEEGPMDFRPEEGPEPI